MNENSTKSKPVITVSQDHSKKHMINKVDDNGYKLMESRSSIRKQIRNSGRLVGAPPPMMNIWVYKVLEGNESIIEKYIKARNINVKQVLKMSKDGSKFISFKILIPKKDVDKVLNTDFWPEGVYSRIWKEYNSRRKNTLSYIGKKYRDFLN